MAGIKYNKKQIEELKANKYVRNVTEKYIAFTDEFKIEALKLDKRGEYHRNIFTKFGFPDFIVKSDIPKGILGNIRFKMKNKGLSGVVSNKKGRKKKEIIDISKMTLEEENEYLRTKIAYLEELNKLANGNYP